ncbi:hypothetical protein PAV_8c01180 [Paenibacillus alvei DSM 29]|nr:hypothetical protein PAV_8c01180 [Paenibacillus alvei DSM 29]
MDASIFNVLQEVIVILGYQVLFKMITKRVLFYSAVRSNGLQAVLQRALFRSLREYIKNLKTLMSIEFTYSGGQNQVLSEFTINLEGKNSARRTKWRWLINIRETSASWKGQ